MAIGDRTHNRKAQAATARVAWSVLGGGAAIEPLEHSGPFDLGDARASIHNTQCRRLPTEKSFNIDLPTCRRVSQGVFHKVVQERFKLLCVPVHADPTGNTCTQIDAALICEHAQLANNFAHDITKLD